MFASTKSISTKSPGLWLVVTAFAVLYVVWGSTFLGMRIAINSIPPLLMAGTRFLVAGLLMLAAMKWRGYAMPTWYEWRTSLITGGLLVSAGNGAVCWAQQTVPTSLAALMVGAVPLWMVLTEWLRPQGARPTLSVVLGLLAGFIGVGLIVSSKDSGGVRMVDPLGAGVLLAGTLGWAIGSIYARQSVHKPKSALVFVGAQMIMGGLLDLVASLLLGEWSHFQVGDVTPESMLAWAYLTLFGSLLAYTSYVWLLEVTTPAKVSTYAYVNPIIAVVLGHWILKEALPTTLFAAGTLILFAVVLITAMPQLKKRS